MVVVVCEIRRVAQAGVGRDSDEKSEKEREQSERTVGDITLRQLRSAQASL